MKNSKKVRLIVSTASNGIASTAKTHPGVGSCIMTRRVLSLASLVSAQCGIASLAQPYVLSFKPGIMMLSHVFHQLGTIDVAFLADQRSCRHRFSLPLTQAVWTTVVALTLTLHQAGCMPNHMHASQQDLSRVPGGTNAI